MTKWWKSRSAQIKRAVILGVALLFIFFDGEDGPEISAQQQHMRRLRPLNGFHKKPKIIANHVGGYITDPGQMPKGLRIVLIGDSLMRYQYLSLVYFLRHRDWIDPNQEVKQAVSEQSGFLNWLDFYNQTNAMLSPYEVCDCWRNVTFDKYTTENRYYYDPSNDNMVYFFQGKFALRTQSSYSYWCFVHRSKPHIMFVARHSFWSQHSNARPNTGPQYQQCTEIRIIPCF